MCFANSAGTLCAVCGWDAANPQQQTQGAILAAREAFKSRSLTYAPETRVTQRDKMVPWLGLGLGLVLLLVVLASCRILY